MSDRTYYPNGNGHAQQSPAEIQQEIQQTRRDMERTLDEIQRRLSPQQMQHMWDEVVEMARTTLASKFGWGMALGAAGSLWGGVAGARSVARTANQTARNHPILVAMAGIGLGWYWLSRQPGYDARMAEMRARMRDYTDRAREGVSHMTERVRGSHGESGEGATDRSYDSMEGADMSRGAGTTMGAGTSMGMSTGAGTGSGTGAGAAGYAAGSSHGYEGQYGRSGGMHRYEDHSHNRMDWVRHQAGPLALLGAGLGWMWLASRPDYDRRMHEMRMRARDYAGRAREGVSHMAERAREMVPGRDDGGSRHMGEGGARYQAEGDAPYYGSMSDQEGMTDRMRHRVGDMGHRVSDTAGRAYEGVRHYSGRAAEGVRHAGSSMNQMMHENPLAIAAIGLAVGAAIGALLPSTETEDEWMGDYADDVREQAREMGQEAVDKATHVAARAADAVGNVVTEETGMGGSSGGSKTSES